MPLGRTARTSRQVWMARVSGEVTHSAESLICASRRPTARACKRDRHGTQSVGDWVQRRASSQAAGSVRATDSWQHA